MRIFLILILVILSGCETTVKIDYTKEVVACTNIHDFKDDLIYLIIKPALKKIIAEFDSRNIEKKNKVYEKHHRTLIQFENNYATVYQDLLQALLLMLNKDFTDNQKAVVDDSQFTTKFANEMEIPD